MNCQEIDKLLPLYVAGDIDSDTAGARAQGIVLHHLRSCSSCRALAEEYRASQAWFASQPPPEFGERFYAEVRQSVLRNINHSSAQPSFVCFVGNLFKRKLVYASSIILLIASSAALVFHLQTDQPRRASVPSDTPVKRASAAEQTFPLSVAASQANSAQPAIKVKHRIAQRRDSTRQARRTLKVFDDVAVKGESAASVESDAGEQEQSALRQRSTLPSELATSSEIASSVIPDELFGEAFETAATDDVANDQAVTRIEIQTSDPNIRIIWLAPKITE